MRSCMLGTSKTTCVPRLSSRPSNRGRATSSSFRSLPSHCATSWAIDSPRMTAMMSTNAGFDSILQRMRPQEPTLHRAAIALGSNMGDRVGYIEKALAEMDARGLRILSTSNLYQTKAMYYENQDPFINGVCYVETTLNPHGLLDVLQDIENRSGRVRSIDKGPRTLDLDILLYDDAHLISDRLEVPHKLMLEREFVLRPLADIKDSMPKTVRSSLGQIEDRNNPMYSVTSLAPQLDLLMPDDLHRKTKLMSILNITPDSFSDGGRLSRHDLNMVRETVREHIQGGALILDVGGQSTRPQADLVSAEDELQRILPVIQAIRAMPEAKKIAISVDTFYAKVAREAIEAGADIINDVSAGQLDSDMLKTVADLGKTVVLMHMRGNPHNMTRLTDYPEGVCAGVVTELGARVQEARRAGILPWRIVLDPGIGFAKTSPQNLELLRNLNWLRRQPVFKGLPWLLGVSRKGFMGKITGVSHAQERVWGTAAAVTASIAGGGDIVRVHDVKEMGQVSKMADAIYR